MQVAGLAICDPRQVGKLAESQIRIFANSKTTVFNEAS